MAYKQLTPSDFQEITNSISKLEKLILETLDFKQVIQRVVDSILFELDYLNLGYRIVVLGLVNQEKQVLERVSISRTSDAEKAIAGLPFPFDQADVPLWATQNFCVKVLSEKKPLITQNWPDILTPPLKREDAKTLQEHVGIKTSMVYPLLVRDKTIGMMIFSVVKDESEVTEQEKWLLLRFTDIVALAVQNAKLYSDLEKTSADLDTANKRLQQLDKLKDEFVSLASHELRTPMTAIKSYTWMVLNNKAGELTPKGREYLDVVYQSTERLIRLVNEMLDISRIESGRIQMKIETFDLVKLLTELKEEFSARVAEKQLTLEMICDEKEIPMTGDRGKILQIIENLIGNATKFTSAGGKITVTATKTDHQATIAVADTGKGIKPEDLAKLFQKFGHLEQGSLTTIAESGTGLGLYISKHYAELHMGTITVASEVGKGTTFTVTLPMEYHGGVPETPKNFTTDLPESILDISNKRQVTRLQAPGAPATGGQASNK